MQISIKHLIFIIVFCLLSFYLKNIQTSDERNHKVLNFLTKIGANRSLEVEKTDSSLEKQFEEFNVLRKVEQSIAYVAATPQELKTRVSYIDSALQFAKERIVNISFVSKGAAAQFFTLFSSFRNGDFNFNPEAELNVYLNKIGNWFEILKKDYLTRTENYHKNCRKNMTSEEENIAKLIFETQQGQICRKATEVLYYHDEFNGRDLGIGSLLHRMSHCFATAIMTGKPCLINDTYFQYDPGNLRLYFRSAMETCPQAKRVPKFSYQIDGSPQIFKHCSVPRVPLRIKNSLEYCVEDLSAWYSGVIMKHGLGFSKFIENSVMELKKSNNLENSFAAVHVRSTDKNTEARIFPASDYLRYLEKICELKGAKTESCKKMARCWVATDSYHNAVDFKHSSEREGSRDLQISTLSQKTFSDSNFSSFRFSKLSAMQILQDLKMMVDSEIAIGTFTSNVLMFTLEMKSVSNQFATDATSSLDAMLYNTIPAMTLYSYYVIDCHYIIPSKSISFLWKSEEHNKWSMDFCKQENWSQPRKTRVYMSAWQGYRTGFVKIAYNKLTNFGSRRFFTPLFNLRKKIETVKKKCH